MAGGARSELAALLSSQWRDGEGVTTGDNDDDWQNKSALSRALRNTSPKLDSFRRLRSRSYSTGRARKLSLRARAHVPKRPLLLLLHLLPTWSHRGKKRRTRWSSSLSAADAASTALSS